jgi:GNAT superfamily N-acetyltransferase
VDWFIRSFQDDDVEAVVELSVRAWTPVFESMRAELGGEIFDQLYPGWLGDQAVAVRDNLAAHGDSTWVAVEDAVVVGFAIGLLADERPIGEVDMVAVDPAYQGRGYGLALTNHVTEWIRAAGKTVAVIGTGGDPGHAPARRTYARAGYRPLVIHRYYKAL